MVYPKVLSKGCGAYDSKSLLGVEFLHGVRISLVIRASIIPILYFISICYLVPRFYLFFLLDSKKKRKRKKIV